MADYEFHEACLAFPPMTSEELESLALDIKEHGLIHEIVQHEGKILDGRSRLAACEMANVPPRFRDWAGECGTPVDFVVAENIERRHLTPSQRGMVAADLVPIFEADAKQRQAKGLKQNNEEPGASEESVTEPDVRANGNGPKNTPRTVVANGRQREKTEKNRKSTEKAAKAVGATPRSTQRAKRIKEQAPPEVVESVRKGETTLRAAEESIAAPKVEDAKVAIDDAGTKLPAKLAVPFSARSKFRALESLHRQYLAGLRELAALPGGAMLRLQEIEADLQNARRQIKFSEPAYVCPYCKCEGPKCAACKACMGRGWVSESTYERAPSEMKAK